MPRDQRVIFAAFARHLCSDECQRMFQVRRAIVVQLSVLFAIGAGIFLASRILPVVDLLASIQQHVMHWGVWSAICYPLLYACCNVLLLPGGLLSVGAGFFFGLWWGFFIALFGNVTGAAISFFISRWIGRQWLKRKLSGNRTLGALKPAVEREGWKIILLSQLHPLFPTSLLNYLYGLTQIRFRTCMLWVAIGQAPGLFLYSYLGTLGQLGLNLARGKTHPRAIEYWVWLGGFASAAVILILLGRIALRVLQEAERKTREDQRTDSFGDEISHLQPTVSQQVMTFHDPNLASVRESRREVTADVRARKKV